MQRHMNHPGLVMSLLMIVAGLLAMNPVTGAASAQSDPTPDLLARAQNFSGSNKDWEPFVQTFDGVEMVLVPAGCFTMGSTEEELEIGIQLCELVYGTCNHDWFEDEIPAHEVCFEEPFWMDRYEVSNAQFNTFGGTAKNVGDWTHDSLPREQINWTEAHDFCELRSARLPTEAEWEYAARGPDGLVFPWGNELIEENVVYSENSGDQAWPVDSRPSGASWVGAYNMSGNVWEWVSSWNMEYPYNAADGREAAAAESDLASARSLRGGSFADSAQHARAANRDQLRPDINGNNDGFRCVRSFLASDLSAIPATDANEDTTPLPTGFTPMQHNDDWELVVQDFNNTQMVLVPAGCFLMGSDYFNSEVPVHKQCFDEPFWIDQTEVTREMYAECVAGGACSGTPMSDYSKRYTQPINLVTWFQATDYCVWQETRLPTEAEWEYAARGPDSLVYPWGNEFIEDNSVFSENSDDTADVGSRPDGASWVGALDMSGNVWEWVSSWYADYPYDAADGREDDLNNDYDDRVARGGGFVDSEGHVRAARRGNFWPGQSSDYIGFRCARSYP